MEECKSYLYSSISNNFAHAAHFFVHFFALVLHDYNVKLPKTLHVTRSYTFYGGLMSYVFLSLIHI